MDKSKPDIKKDNKKPLEAVDNNEVEEEDLEEMAVEDIRAHILQYYGINHEEELEKKEKKAQKFRAYIANSGLQLGFQLVISEILSKEIPKEEFFKYAAKRMKEIGKEYHDIKEGIATGDQGKGKKDAIGDKEKDKKEEAPKGGKKGKK